MSLSLWCAHFGRTKLIYSFEFVFPALGRSCGPKKDHASSAGQPDIAVHRVCVHHAGPFRGPNATRFGRPNEASLDDA